MLEIRKLILTEKVECLREKYRVPMILGCNSSIGYYVQINLARTRNINSTILTTDFILLRRTKNTAFVTTDELIMDNQKCQEICEEIHIISNV